MSEDPPAVGATGIGSMPGADARAYDAALDTVLGVLGEPPGTAYLPELPGRGSTADMTGRALAVVDGLGADLQPAGWRLTGSGPGLDQRRARSLLAQDLDALEERAQEWSGPLKVQVAGPWTLAATVERPRGDKVLADRGARRDLAQGLAEGLRAHLADVRRRVPGAEPVVQVDEPLLPAVLAGGVTTASGFGRHRSVDDPAASPPLEWVLSAVREEGGLPLVHCCAPRPPVPLLTGAGAQGVSVDLTRLDATAYDELAIELERGRSVLLGVVPATEPQHEHRVEERSLVGQVTRVLDMLGLDPESVAGQLTVTPTCGLAGASPAWARRALRLCLSVARSLG